MFSAIRSYVETLEDDLNRYVTGLANDIANGETAYEPYLSWNIENRQHEIYLNVMASDHDTHLCMDCLEAILGGGNAEFGDDEICIPCRKRRKAEGRPYLDPY